MKAKWLSTLEASVDEATLAVDLYNQSGRARRLEAFFVHMHMGWLYLFQAQYQRDKLEYHYRLENGRYLKVDGEPKTWELAKFAATELSDECPELIPVRKNLELTILLRNKIEHRFDDSATLFLAGYAQSLLLNYEEYLTRVFGAKYSMDSVLRFPIFIGSLTREGATRLNDVQKQFPKTTRDLLHSFEAGINPSVTQDHHYEFRIRLIPKLGSKSDTDLALTFVRESDLSDDERAMLGKLGRTGQVIVREQVRSVSNENLMKPTLAASNIEKKIPFKFKVHHLVSIWKRMALRPPDGDPHPERTKEDFCVYDRPHRDYLYTAALVEKMVSDCATESGFQESTGMNAVFKDSSA